jgi:hypothetical protein
MEYVRYTISYHAIERIKERFPVISMSHPEIKNWERAQGLNPVKPVIDTLIKSSEVNKSIINNTQYMVRLYEKYGYDMDYCFMENKKYDMVFVMTKPRDKSHYHIMTVMPGEYRPLAKNTKYLGKETKQNKTSQEMLNLYDRINDLRENTLKRDRQFHHSSLHSIEEKLIEKCQQGQVTILEKISNARSRCECELENEKYVFVYKRKTGQSPASVEELQLQNEMTTPESNRRFRV